MSGPAASSSQPPARLGAREVKFAGAPLAKVSADGIFEGYASLFGVVDLGRDRVAPGAFRDSLARKGIRAIKLLWQHDPAIRSASGRRSGRTSGVCACAGGSTSPSPRRERCMR